MLSVNIRTGDTPFRDAKRFPYGFNKSGDFSISESHALSTYGTTLEALEAGTLSPETDDERHFVDVVNGKAEQHNSIEKAWLKYIGLARKRRSFYTVHSSSSSSLSDNDEYYDDEEIAN